MKFHEALPDRSEVAGSTFDFTIFHSVTESDPKKSKAKVWFHDMERWQRWLQVQRCNQPLGTGERWDMAVEAVEVAIHSFVAQSLRGLAAANARATTTNDEALAKLRSEAQSFCYFLVSDSLRVFLISFYNNFKVLQRVAKCCNVLIVLIVFT